MHRPVTYCALNVRAWARRYGGVFRVLVQSRKISDNCIGRRTRTNADCNMICVHFQVSLRTRLLRCVLRAHDAI